MYFKNKYYFLSNMYPCDIEIVIDGKKYNFTCVESAFQAHKCPDRISEFIQLNGYEAVNHELILYKNHAQFCTKKLFLFLHK